MSEDFLFAESLKLINDISSNHAKYIPGILLKDNYSQKHIEILAHMQAIIMQSIQIRNFKRALRYIVAYKKIIKHHISLADRLTESITDYLVND